MKKLFKILKRSVFYTLILLITITSIALIYMLHPKFGKAPAGEYLEKIKSSSSYKDNKFENLVPRPTITKGYSISGLMYNMAFKKHKDRIPSKALPYIRTDLKSLNKQEDLIVWFGHSSLYMQLEGKSFLIDPVFSGSASPIPGFVKAFKGTNEYQVEDMPQIDYLIISHDHYDHLDYKTIVALKEKVGSVLCGLGVRSHLEFWGYSADKINELDRYDTLNIDNEIKIYALPTHHSSGRSLKQNKTLWLSYLLQTPKQKIYFNGDGGYDDAYKKIGEQFGSIDFAIMECGQYNPAWQSVHKLPHETHQATLDINAQRIMTVHHSKFTLAYHPWYEPLETMSALARNAPYTLVTPMMGEVLYLNNTTQQFTEWWKAYK